MPTNSDRNAPCTITGAVTMKLPSGPSASLPVATSAQHGGEAERERDAEQPGDGRQQRRLGEQRAEDHPAREADRLQDGDLAATARARPSMRCWRR